MSARRTTKASVKKSTAIDAIPQETRRSGKAAIDTIARTPRIAGRPVPPLIPKSGDVPVLIVGEAPGPRGADKSGYPFFGDGAGKHLYRALREIGAIELPDAVDGVKWDGTVLRAAGFAPIAHQISLGNAFDRCPTDDGQKFRAPSRVELESEANVTRIVTEIHALQRRNLTGIVTLGKVATRIINVVLERASLTGLPVFELPHPAAQGLLSMAENRGKGARMNDLQAQWMQKCIAAVRAAGFQDASVEHD